MVQPWMNHDIFGSEKYIMAASSCKALQLTKSANVEYFSDYFCQVILLNRIYLKYIFLYTFSTSVFLMVCLSEGCVLFVRLRVVCINSELQSGAI